MTTNDDMPPRQPDEDIPLGQLLGEVLDLVDETVARITDPEVDGHLRRVLNQAGHGGQLTDIWPACNADPGISLVDLSDPAGAVADLIAAERLDAKLASEHLRRAEETAADASRQAEQIVADARDKAVELAAKMVRDAREQAERIVSEARAEAEQIVTAARNQRTYQTARTTDRGSPELLRLPTTAVAADQNLTDRAGQGKCDPPSVAGSRSERSQVVRLILELGPATAATLGGRLGLTPAAIRRHLDNLMAEGLIETRMVRTYATRGRGRPAKVFVITDAGRVVGHAYDDLATSALRFLAETAGPDTIAEFARRQVSDLERRYAPTVAQGDLLGRVQMLAKVLAEFPQLSEAETEAFGRLLGTPVQRLATIAHRDGICTTHAPAAAPAIGSGPDTAGAPGELDERAQKASR